MVAVPVPPPAPPQVPALTPEGALHLHPDVAAAHLQEPAAAAIAAAFALGAGAGLLHLGAAEVATVLPQPWAFWRDVAARFVAALRREAAEVAAGAGEVHAGEIGPRIPAEAPAWLAAAPPFPGAEYLDLDVLASLWQAMARAAAAAAGGDVAGWLQRQHPSWRAVGCVHLHLAEHRGDDARPFAFMATYTTQLAAGGRAQHLPLGRALQQASSSGDRRALLALLAPVQRAAEACPWLRQKLDDGELYRPARWSVAEACALLRDVPLLDAAGVVVKLPATWARGRPARAEVRVTVDARPGGLGVDALLDVDVALCVDGEALTAAECRALLASSAGLELVRGRWVEVDAARLQAALDHYQAAQQRADDEGLDFHAALRLLAGASARTAGPEALLAPAWSAVVAGPRLEAVLRELRDPDGAMAPLDPGPELRATLRPYQARGVAWLHLLARMGLGACLADDMGLGKTLQVLALLLVLRRQGVEGPALVVVPASLLGNWQSEAERFAPSLRVAVAHASARPERLWRPGTDGAAPDFVLTTYGTLLRDERLRARPWALCVLDEAQAIKNPSARQTRAVKAVAARARIAMTGTPVENRLADLWSLMDFLNPGLLGGAAEFTAFTKRLEAAEGGFAPLRRLTAPYLLRRRKTDKAVIADLPDKTELQTYCSLTRAQAAHYQAAVEALRERLANSDGVARRGAVLAALMRFKQICNHPSQWLGDGAYAPADSGKFARLCELAETIALRREKLLVFTQFREMTEPLSALLGGVFGQPGLVLHGGTAVRQRADLVARFQGDPELPFLVLSLKAGGTGLNLTAASHVVHFDRWWNPAVEDQATDRAFRIGQRRNVLVHKFVCRGTVEERIDRLIADKRALADDALGGGAEVALTELSDSDLLAMVALDLDAATAEAD